MYIIFIRKIIILQLLNNFIEEFFDQNPISQMGIIVMKNKRAEKVSDLTGTCKKHIKVNKINKNCFALNYTFNGFSGAETNRGNGMRWRAKSSKCSGNGTTFSQNASDPC